MINIRQLSIQCGHCGTYQTLCHFLRGEEWNVYTYECENEVCDREVTRTRLEVPVGLDAFARRNPQWGGGRRHAGAAGVGGAEEGSQEGAEEAGDDGEPAGLVQLGAPAAKGDSEVG